MPTVTVQADRLNQENRRFAQLPLSRPLFLNSVPKSGSHLLRNIVRMFVPVDQHYGPDFIQWPTLQQHRAAFAADRPKLSWGHLFFADASAVETAPAHRILLYRDPYDWVLARARFFISEQFDGNVDQLRSGHIEPDELLTMMIFGIPGKAPSLHDIYELNAAAWLGARIHAVRYEELASGVANLETEEADRFFGDLLAACGIVVPDDWRDRVRIGADRRHSGTARENLTGVGKVLPDELGHRHRALVDYHAPGLRALLGYC